MSRLVLDCEYTTTEKSNGKPDHSPFNPHNKLVSVGWWNMDTNEQDYFFVFHKRLPENYKNTAKLVAFENQLQHATIIIGHNLKADLSWLRECNFPAYSPLYFDTMVCEYVLLRGQPGSLDLDTLTHRYDCEHKKLSDLTQPYLDKGLTFADIPIEIIEEYGPGDVLSTGELYLKQLARLALKENQGLTKTIDMSMAFMDFLTDMERNGISIDTKELDRVAAEYEIEQAKLNSELRELVFRAVGDTPINLNSPAQLSELIYSRRVVSKHAWAEEFNIGLDARGKALRRPKLGPTEFISSVRKHTTVLFKTKAFLCPACDGAKVRHKIRKDGSLFKNATKCGECGGEGLVYEQLKEVAGFKLSPRNVDDVSSGGFSTDKDTLTYHLSLLEKGTDVYEALTRLIRLGAIDVYLSSFVGGIRRGLEFSVDLHAKFNQVVTATARLSSSEPNFQNQPRGTTFPVKRSIKSRFLNGTILEADYRQLEFRTAAILSCDAIMVQDILDGIDVHARTSQVMTDAGQPTNRQDAKPHTFKPLYGGQSGTAAEMAYYAAFMARYPQLQAVHDEWQEQAIADHIIRIPSGREYAFPYAKRNYYGGATGATQIKNYPVQGFATGDLVPIACLIVQHLLNQNKCKSVIFIEVHDSMVLDVFPGEEEIVKSCVTRGMIGVKAFCERWYEMKFVVPLDIELKMGPNWLDMKAVDHEKYLTEGLDIGHEQIIYKECRPFRLH